MLNFLSEIFLKRLAGRKDIEDALQRLDKLTQEEALMVATHGLKATNVVDNKVTRVGNDVQGIGDKVQDVDTRVEEIGKEAVESEQIVFNTHFHHLKFSSGQASRN